MLNLRKLKQDFASAILKDGKQLFDDEKVLSAKILALDTETLKIGAKVLGQYDNTYESEIEIDRTECEMIDSNCDCPYQYDCGHLAALLFHLEANLDEILVNYSKETDLEEIESVDEDEKEKILQAVKAAESKEELRRGEALQKEVIEEYISASKILTKSPFFLPREKFTPEQAELAILFQKAKDARLGVELQLALRLQSRSKPLNVPNVKLFLEALRYQEPQVLGGRKHYFTLESFQGVERELVQILCDHSRFLDATKNDRAHRSAYLDPRIFGMVCSKSCAAALETVIHKARGDLDDRPKMPALYQESFESPLLLSTAHAAIRIGLEHITEPSAKILLSPMFMIDGESVMLEKPSLFYAARPGLIHDGVYYQFEPHITRQHLWSLGEMREITIPEPLFGTFVENALPELTSFAEVANLDVIEEFVTLPFAQDIEPVCDISYLDGELEASLHFRYDDQLIPASSKELTHRHLDKFLSDDGIIARDLVDEGKIVDELFRDFLFDQETEKFVAKSEKKIIEFMTDLIPQFQNKVEFNCPQNLLDQFIYDDTEFTLKLSHLDRMDVYQIEVGVKGPLQNVSMDRLWDCVASRRPYLELETRDQKSKKKSNKMSKILVLDLEKSAKLIQLFDEIGIITLKSHKLERPIWSIAGLDASYFKHLPVKFSMSTRLREIRKQMLGEKTLEFTPVPKQVKAEVRPYQLEGVQWMERLRSMYLSGILADDMGLGKTLQTIVALVQNQGNGPALIVCPTSLLYNWKEEFHKFAPHMKVCVIEGMPQARKKLIGKLKNFDIIVTSYSLIQKDVEVYGDTCFSYMVLDEAQHIKNRGTRNAKSVKKIKANHRLILSGTPIENALEELWSLFDFLMPGFLGSYERFVDKYIRVSGEEQRDNLEYLRKKIGPFVMRRMKADVLDDLPSISENIYHCQLSKVQTDLYKSYAQSARDELVKLVERDGFDKVQIHVLATLTRLKQICCHPAIFAKEEAESGDSAKYEMLLDLLDTLIEGGHKTVIFSQYTGMLQIMRQDFERMGIPFAYLDGSSKNRLEIVKSFNNDPSIPVFLVSLKAGGTGLNLTSADTVIHYDMWWNPAVEAQATDRVHRLGQKQNVSVYKLVTLSSIEEKIVEMQNRKKGIVKKIVSCDDEAITKLTWEDVLELLQT